MSAAEKMSYREVKRIVFGRIRDQTWPPDSVIPGEVELAAEFGCARATVNRAMRELAEEGILDRKRKAGTRVNAMPKRSAKFAIPLVRTEVEALGAKYRYYLVKRRLKQAPTWLRSRLNLGEDTRMLHLDCMHYAGARAFQFEERWININTVPEAEHADFTEIGPNEWLIKKVPFSDGEISFGAELAPAPTAKLLAIASGAPVFVAERITWLNSAPVTFARMSFASGYRLTSRF